MATKKRASDDRPKQELYLQLVEEREHGYFHLRGRFVTQRYDQAEGHVCYGVDDDYSDGLLWTGLRTDCQGDDRSRERALAGDAEPVYGFDVEYKDGYSLGLRKVRRMLKTLEKLDRGLDKLREARGYVRTYGEYIGRVAEVMSCKGIVFAVNAKQDGRYATHRWTWLSIGDGVNRANGLIHAWVDEARAERNAVRQLTGETDTEQVG